MGTILSYCCCYDCFLSDHLTKGKKKKKKKPKEKSVPKSSSPNPNWTDVSSITPSDIPDNAFTREFLVPSDDYPTEDSVFKERGYDGNWDSNGKMTYFIGSGAFGCVYKVARIEDGSELACKVIDLIDKKVTTKRDEQKITDLKNEIWILSKVKHKNIISLFDHFIINNKSYIFMELANGGTLDQEVIKWWPFTELEVKIYFSQITLALNHLHRNKMAHKDLKLANILICVNNNVKILKLTDFGLSRVAFKGQKIIRTRNPQGTLHYMSPQIVKLYLRKKVKEPEKLGKFTEFDPFCADIWALGVCLYVLVNKVKPYKVTKDPETLMNNMYSRQINRNYRPITQTITKELKDLIDSMLEPNYNLRITMDGIRRHPWLIGYCSQSE